MPSNPFSLTITATGTTTYVSNAYVPDYVVRPFNLSVGVIATSSGSSAAFNYNVEYTLDNTGRRTPATISAAPGGQNLGALSFVSSALNWFSSLLTGAASNAAINIGFPVSGIRLNLTAATSNCAATLNITQAG